MTLLRQALVAELSQFLQEEGDQFPALANVWHTLQSRGKVLAKENGFSWGMLPVLVCEAAGGQPQQALPLGVAMECFIAALDTIDDVQDGDAPDALFRRCGVPTAINVATFLLFLSQLAIDRLRHQGVSDSTIVKIVKTFAGLGARACGGQQRDLDLMSGQAIDEEQYLAMISQKSASLVECACRSGALLGTASPEDVEAFAQFGFNLGVAMQINNDVAGVSSESADRSDLRTGKRTLPLIFALECAAPLARQELAAILPSGRTDHLCAEEIDRARSVLEASGSLHYATTIADVYFERALSCLVHVGCRQGSALFDLIAQMHRD